jgi:hypothetical protein
VSLIAVGNARRMHGVCVVSGVGEDGCQKSIVLQFWKGSIDRERSTCMRDTCDG